MALLRATSRCRPEVEATAEALVDLAPAEAEQLAEALIEAGEGAVLGILMLVVGLNRLKLNPILLARIFRVVEPATDICYPYRVQDEAAIELLLAAVTADGVSWERQAYGGRLAAELAVMCDARREAVGKVLRKLAFKIRIPELAWLVEDAAELLEPDAEADPSVMVEIHREPLKDLPETKPPVVIGGSYTVRRPVGKIGRNDPCHCGSGRKYKKCCLEKDRQRMRDASPYEGITMSQLCESPEQIDDDTFIRQMTASELKKLDAGRMNDQQLLAAHRRAEWLRLYDKALEMLIELQKRPGRETEACNCMEDLLFLAIAAHETRIARRIFEHLAPEALKDREDIAFQMDLLTAAERYKDLDAQLRRALVTDDETVRFDNPLVAAAHLLESRLPALSIVFARAAIAGNPERFHDNEILMDVIRSARLELDLDPYGDAAEDIFERSLKLEENRLDSDRKEAEIEVLRQKAAAAEKRAAETSRLLFQKERELAAMEVMVKTAETVPHAKGDASETTTAGANGAERETILRLRSHVERLKAEVGLQQQERRALRRQLAEEKRKPRPVLVTQQGAAIDTDPEEIADAGGLPKLVRIPEFAETFRRSCENLPAPVVARALRAAVGCALQEPSVRRQSRPIDAYPGLYRLRIGRQYRLLFQREKASGRLQFLDLINRQDFETWLRHYSR